MHTRRSFVVSLAGAAASLAAARGLAGQQTPPGLTGQMDQSAYRPVRLPAKPGAAPSMSDDERDALERRLKCQCPCVLDVFTCRTTDFSCGISPAMHRDVISLVEGGYDDREILTAFQNVYGERIHMAPLRQGFNWVGYIMPFAALGIGGGSVAMIIRRWRARAVLQVTEGSPPPLDATDAELAELDAAVRDDS